MISLRNMSDVFKVEGVAASITAHFIVLLALRCCDKVWSGEEKLPCFVKNAYRKNVIVIE